MAEEVHLSLYDPGSGLPVLIPYWLLSVYSLLPLYISSGI